MLNIRKLTQNLTFRTMKFNNYITNLFYQKYKSTPDAIRINNIRTKRMFLLPTPSNISNKLSRNLDQRGCQGTWIRMTTCAALVKISSHAHSQKMNALYFPKMMSTNQSRMLKFVWLPWHWQYWHWKDNCMWCQSSTLIWWLTWKLFVKP